MSKNSYAVLLFGTLGLAGVPLPAASAEPDVVVELFTSQSCSSCPPADALLGEISHADPHVLALDFHVDYWNRLGWRDPYSSADATARQEKYASSIRGSEVYTPQIVVAGATQMVGSDRERVHAAIEAARADTSRMKVSLDLASGGNALTVNIGNGNGSGTLLLVGYDDQHVTAIGGGENSGRTLTETNVVRSIKEIGRWSGGAETLTMPSPAGQHAALLLQADDGHILASVVMASAS